MRSLLLAFYALFAVSAFAQSPSYSAPQSLSPTDAAIAAFVDGSIATSVERLGLPSASVVVVRSGQPILKKSYGLADYAQNRAADPDRTLYRQASISKLFSWILVMQQVEAGKLDLDTDVNRYLGFKIPDAYGKPITLRHLMTHTAGFTERLRGIFDDGPPAPAETLLRENIPDRSYPPGSTLAYSNYGAALAAHIAERSAGKPFDTLVHERILGPLGMTRSTFAQPLPRLLAADVATGYAPGSREGLPFEWVATTAAGGMSSTPADMGRFLAMLMNGGSLDGVQILKPETLAHMLRLHRPLAPGFPAGENAGMGLGFIGGTQQGVRYMGHLGNLAGTATLITFLPDDNIGVYLAFNGQGNAGAASSIRRDLIADLIARFAKGQPAAITPNPKVSTADAVAGTYLSARRHHDGFLTIGNMVDPTVVKADEDGAITLSTVARSDGSLRRWLPVAADRFAEAETGSPLAFERDASGAVTGMTGPLAYPVAEFDRAPSWLARAPLALFAAIAILAITVIAVPVHAIAHRSHKHPDKHQQPDAHSPAAQRPARSFVPARLGALAMVAAFALWVFYLLSAEANLALFTTRADPWLVALRILTGLAVLGGGFLVLDAILAWKDTSRTLWRKLWAQFSALAAMVLLAIIFKFDLLLFSNSY